MTRAQELTVGVGRGGIDVVMPIRIDVTDPADESAEPNLTMKLSLGQQRVDQETADA